MNDSSTGGILGPSSAAPLYDAALDAVFQALVRDITGLADDLVRPRWTPVVSRQPDVTVDWAGVGVTSATPDANAAFVNNGADMQRHETLEVQVSLYGPNARGLSARLRDGLSVSQNREAIKSQSINLVEVGQAVNAADLLNNQWVRRVDVTLTFRRQVNRTYPVLNILDLTGEINTGDMSVPLGPLVEN